MFFPTTSQDYHKEASSGWESEQRLSAVQSVLSVVGKQYTVYQSQHSLITKPHAAHHKHSNIRVLAAVQLTNIIGLSFTTCRLLCVQHLRLINPCSPQATKHTDMQPFW